MDNSIIDAYAALIESTAGWDEDVANDLFVTIDPEGLIYQAWVDREHAREAARRSALTEAERAAEGAEIERLVQHGLVIMRQVMARLA